MISLRGKKPLQQLHCAVSILSGVKNGPKRFSMQALRSDISTAIFLGTNEENKTLAAMYRYKAVLHVADKKTKPKVCPTK